MCCTGGTGGTRMTRCGVFCGLAALAALTTALLGPSWLHTEERYSLPQMPKNIANLVTVKFKLGLFKVCPKIVKPTNVTLRLPSPSCRHVKYNNLDDVKSEDLGLTQLDFTPIVVTKMRISAPFQVAAAALIFAGTISAMIGHCYSDHRTLVACGLFLLGGLSLGGGLIVLASALSDASLELPRKYTFSTSRSHSDDNGLPQYQYGWCLQLSGLALILAELAALLTVSGYMARFPTVEDMVRVMVPGAERKLREQRGLSSEYLVRTHQKSPGPPQSRGFTQPEKGAQKVAEEGTSLLCKSAPDICASNPQSISYVDKADLSHMLPAYPEGKIPDPRFTFVDKADQSVVDSRLSGFADKEGLMDSRMLSESRQNIITFSESKEHQSGQEPRFTEFAGRVEQATIIDPRVSFSDKEGYPIYADKGESLLDTSFGYDTRYNSLAGQTVPITLKHQATSVSAIQPQYIYQNFGTIHSGMLRVSEPGTSSSSNSSLRSMTLQNPKRKSQIAQNTFSTMECEKRKRAPGLGFYSGSAV
ncbi:uncharacterized protein LOC127286899 [Leptopilina boulardi]|uniref:uncharacterized protein LOC127286899 n=1 Tax=Leptopilina boulardi TaxID=63433 RepID=UPI0021F63FA0|nr:uncharacterized protein LOC127286899 [Leptopilina boulardi]XP_051169481.1 uncharacterized protein LOC127286899 [Leptopilina boulardi]XP_051169482.1 uncharacterized protein LOC127286899 [Leptopilina boulardi]